MPQGGFDADGAMALVKQEYAAEQSDGRRPGPLPLGVSRQCPRRRLVQA